MVSEDLSNYLTILPGLLHENPGFCAPKLSIPERDLEIGTFHKHLRGFDRFHLRVPALVERPWGEPHVVLSSPMCDRFAYMVAPQDSVHLLHLTLLLVRILVPLACFRLRGEWGEGLLPAPHPHFVLH